MYNADAPGPFTYEPPQDSNGWQGADAPPSPAPLVAPTPQVDQRLDFPNDPGERPGLVPLPAFGFQQELDPHDAIDAIGQRGEATKSIRDEIGKDKDETQDVLVGIWQRGEPLGEGATGTAYRWHFWDPEVEDHTKVSAAFVAHSTKRTHFVPGGHH